MMYFYEIKNTKTQEHGRGIAKNFAGAPTAQARQFYHYTTASAICQEENKKKNK